MSIPVWIGVNHFSTHSFNFGPDRAILVGPSIELLNLRLQLLDLLEKLFGGHVAWIYSAVKAGAGGGHECSHWAMCQLGCSGLCGIGKYSKQTICSGRHSRITVFAMSGLFSFLRFLRWILDQMASSGRIPVLT